MINTKRIGNPLGEETWATLYLLNLPMIPPRTGGVSSIIMAHFSLVLAPDDLNIKMPILACTGLVQAKNQQDYRNFPCISLCLHILSN